MTTNVSGFPAVAVPKASARESRHEGDEGQASFAGMFADATHAQARPVQPVEKKEGTSELDGSSEVDDHNDTGDVGETKGGDKAQAATMQRDPAMVGFDRAMVTVDPALQENLGRVMARMRDDAGQDVQVSETYSQPRQDALITQGRSAPGPVATWTPSAKHTQGPAVDLLLDKGDAGSDAYVAPRRIATEEGLRTLGERDPGHLELPVNDSIATADATGDPGVASIANVVQLPPAARVIEVNVARPAAVARVASIARPEVSTSVTRPATTTSPAPAPVDASAVVARSDANIGGQRFGANPEGRGGKSENDHDATGYSVPLGAGKHSTMQFSVPGIATDLGSSAPQRVAHVIAAREDAPARPLSQIVMNVDAGNGTTDRIQLDLRGSSLNATIDAADLHAAHAMSARSNELVRALTRDGMDVESLQVRAAASAAGPGAAEASHRSSDSSSNSRFERGAQWQQQDRQRSEGDRRQQQRDERGGKES